MKSTERIWSALEGAALSGVRAAWVRELQDDYDVLAPFLRPRPGLVETYPCDFPGYGCPREVICHGDGDMVAVCRSTEIECETLKLTKADLVSYELDFLKLGSALRALLPIGGPEPSIDADFFRAAVLGTIGASGSDVRAYFALPFERRGEEAKIIIERLLARHSGGFLLLLPKNELLPPLVTTTLAHRGARVLWLNEVTGIENGEIVLKDPSIGTRLFNATGEARLDRPSFVRQGRCYVVSFRGKSASFPILVGLQCIAILLTREGKRVPSNELATRPDSAAGMLPIVAAAELGTQRPVARGRRGADSDLVFDKKGRKRIEDEIAEHRAAGRIEEAEDLEVHLRGAIDISGKTRQLGSPRDRKRVNVGKRIRLALDLLGRDLPELYAHFETTLTTGGHCAYCPPTPMNWDVRI